MTATREASVAGAPTAASSERLWAYVLLGFAVIVWGASFVAARAVLAPADPNDGKLSPTTLAALRFVLAAILFAPPLLARWLRNRTAERAGTLAARRLDRGDLLRLFGLGQLGIAVYFWLQYTGVSLTNAGVASILVVGLIPIATALTARLQLGEALHALHGLALALGLTGVIVVATQRGGVEFGFSRDFALGAACLVANAACFAVYSTIVRDFRARFDSLTLTAGTTGAGALGLVVLAALTGGWEAIGGLTTAQWLAVIYLALICSVLAYFCYNRALSILEAGKAAAWVYLEPPVALLLGALLLDERISLASILGGLLIAASVWVITRAK